MVAIHKQSKADTRFLCPGTLATDLSQYRTNLTATGARAYEVPSVRTGLVGAREIAVAANLDDNDNGILAMHSDGATANCTWSVRVLTGNILFGTNNSVVATVPMPDVSSGAAPFVIHWSTRPEGTSMRSEFLVYNVDENTVNFAIRTHAAHTTNAAWGLYINGSHLVGGVSGSSVIEAVRVSERFHSTAEAVADWVSERTPPAMAQVRRLAALVPDRDTLDLADDGALCGPSHRWPAHTFTCNDRRLVGALVNLRVPDPLEVTHDYDQPSSAWWRTAPDDPAMHMCVAWLWYRPVPLKVTHARVRVFVRLNNGTDPVAEFTVRAYSLANLPVVGEPAQPLAFERTGAASTDTSHGSTAGAGEWLDLGDLPLQVDALGCTWLALAVAFDEESDDIADTEAFIHAVTIEPFELGQEF